jgi:hypothetical protein
MLPPDTDPRSSNNILLFVVPPEAPPYFTYSGCTLDYYQTLVGGMIELVRFPSGCGCYINEEGKLLNLPPNNTATAIVDSFLRGFARHDFIAGTAVFIGPADDEGNDTTLPPELVELFSKRFNVSVPSCQE